MSSAIKFINQNPDYAEAYRYRGEAKLRLGDDVGEAEADFLVALQLAEDSGDWALANEIRTFLDENFEHTEEGEKNE